MKEQDDLPGRLRRGGLHMLDRVRIARESADEIERLRAQLVDVRNAVEQARVVNGLLVSRAESAEVDVARLDWLSKQSVIVRKPLRYGAAVAGQIRGAPDLEEEFWDLRSAIDAEMKRRAEEDK